jgi:hypothetical protein
MADPIPFGPWQGLNLLDPGPDDLELCQNCRLTEGGHPVKRPGYGDYGSSPEKINGDVASNFHHRFYRSDGSKELVAAAGGKFKRGNDSTGAWTQIDIDGVGGNNMESTLLSSSFVYKDRLYVVDGLKPHRYNGTDDVYAGHFIPSPTGWVLTPGTGGSLKSSSTYKYKMSIVAGNMGEGPASTEKSVALSGSQNRVTLSNLDSAPATHEATAKNLYRTKADGSVFFFLAQISAGATSHIDNTADTALGKELIPTHIPRADCRFAVVSPEERVYWFGRTGENASLVEASDIGFPDRVLDADFFAVANNDGDILTGGGRTPGGVVFAKRNSLWFLRAFGFGLINLSTRIGTLSPFSIVEVPGGLMFLGTDGSIYFVSNSPPQDIGQQVKKEFLGMTSGGFGRVVSTYHDFRYIIAYDHRGSRGYNWKKLEFDLRSRRWEGPHDNGDLLTASYFSVWDKERDQGELSWGESRAAAGSYIRIRTEQTKTDNGEKFISTARSSRRYFQGQNEKKIYKAFLRGRFSSDAEIEMNVIQDDDSKVTAMLTGTATVVVNPGIWGTSLWGAAKWVGKTEQNLSGSYIPKGRSRNPKVELTDRGTATEMRIEEVRQLVEILPLK